MSGSDQSAPKGGSELVWWVGVVWCGGCALGLRVRGRRGVWRAGAAPLGSFWGGGCGAASRGGHRSDRPRRASCVAQLARGVAHAL